MIQPVYKDEKIIIFRCEDLFYPQYAGNYFVLEKSSYYGYFDHMVRKWTRGEILDKFNIQFELK